MPTSSSYIIIILGEFSNYRCIMYYARRVQQYQQSYIIIILGEFTNYTCTIPGEYNSVNQLELHRDLARCLPDPGGQSRNLGLCHLPQIKEKVKKRGIYCLTCRAVSHHLLPISCYSLCLVNLARIMGHPVYGASSQRRSNRRPGSKGAGN